MDDILKRLGNLFRSNLNYREESPQEQKGDSDFSDAMDELDDFLQGRKSKPAEASGPKRVIPKEYTKDFANLELSPTEDFELVKGAYKRLMHKYHPDRHAHDPEAQKTATEITKKLNESFARLKKYFGTLES